jgi:hypothetical protein
VFIENLIERRKRTNSISRRRKPKMKVSKTKKSRKNASSL